MRIISGSLPRRSPAGAVVRAAGRAMKRWWLAYMTWRIERLAIARLSAMSDRQLKDIAPHSPLPEPLAPCCATPSRARS
jgi:uncharacterized protein YjiS (DUF1127 family)